MAPDTQSNDQNAALPTLETAFWPPLESPIDDLGYADLGTLSAAIKRVDPDDVDDDDDEVEDEDDELSDDDEEYAGEDEEDEYEDEDDDEDEDEDLDDELDDEEDDEDEDEDEDDIKLI